MRTNITPAHIAEEAANIRKVKSAPYCVRVRCRVLILRATEGLLREDDLLLPEDVVEHMLRRIPQPQCVIVARANHYDIAFQPRPSRDRAIRRLLAES